jgi:steroid delta-isomerase-like uncharacterized protein
MTTPQNSITRHKWVARRLYEEVLSHGRLEELPELVAEDATGFSADGTLGPQGFADHVQGVRDGLSDVRATVTDLLAEDDRVVVYWRIQGVHTGTVWGVPASGGAVDGTSVSLITFRDGRIVDYQVRPDRLTVLEQLGALAPSAVTSR